MQSRAIVLTVRQLGSTHITAFSDEAPLPLDPTAVTPAPSDIGRLQAISEWLSPMFSADRIIARQACFRPVTEDGLPLIGKVPQIEGAYVATGHSVWGILNALATGEAVAELIADGVARSDPNSAPAARPVAPAPRLTSLSMALGPHLLYGFLTTSPNAVVEPIHPKAI